MPVKIKLAKEQKKNYNIIIVNSYTPIFCDLIEKVAIYNPLNLLEKLFLNYKRTIYLLNNFITITNTYITIKKKSWIKKKQ